MKSTFSLSKKHILTLFFFFSFLPLLQAQNFTLSGYVRDSITQETINKASILAQKTGTTTLLKAQSNAYGFYSITLSPGNYKIIVSAQGYPDAEFSINAIANQNATVRINLFSKPDDLGPVTINAKRNSNVKSLDVSVQSINGQTIKKIPALLGEPDVIRSVQLLPGVTTVGEGASGFNVRGGGIDQNLVLMDEAPVFNSAHLFGFFSIFNPDAVKDVELVKGGIPSNYGGRLSSTLDVKTRDGNKSRLSGSGGVGTIFSRFTLEGPLALPEKNQGQSSLLNSLTKNRKNPAKSSFLVSGRRSYIDFLAKPFLKDSSLSGSQFYFYDLTTKFNYSTGKNNFFISSYIGDDVFKAAGLFGVKWGNSTVTGRWNHVFNNKLFSNFTYYYSRYRYNIEFTNRDAVFNWQSYIVNNSLKADFNWLVNPKNSVSFGAQTTYYRFIPGDARAKSNSLDIKFGLPDRYALENAVYISNDWNANGKFSVRAGLRVSNFDYLGPGKVYLYSRQPGQQGILDSVYSTKRGQTVASYIYPEPRLSFKWQLGNTSSIKGGYNRMVQNLHLISNTAASVPFDVWQPTTNNIKPEIADQVSVGYFRNFGKNSGVETSVETYYKKFQNQVDYIDGANLLLNEFLEADLLTGIGRAYGLEVYVKKSTGKLTGWVSYTLSRSERKVVGINNNDWYANRFDRKHNLAVVAQYKLNNRLEFAANFIFSSGTPTTFYTGQYKVQGYTVPDAGSNARNNVRNPNYHRLDLSLTYYRKKTPKKESYWVFSTYNTYNRRNPFSIYFATNYKDMPANAAIRYSVIGSIVPAVSYNFKF